tara:strand:- start:1590 stop:2360 length:771 start_codon:yes stop_codon:yes gene_type:complete
MTDFNLNADMAEGYGPWRMGDDDGLLQIISSANIACGFHAGDYQIMGAVMKLADSLGVSIGAHPSFYDLHGFGRRQMRLSYSEIERLIAYQLGASLGIAAAEHACVTHIKPHGAINNMACADASLSAAIVRAVKAIDSDIIMLAPVLSELLTEAEKAGLPVAAEVFADRAYMPDGQLVPRGRPDAMIHDPEASLTHCLRMFGDGEIQTVDGGRLRVMAQSVCVHGDGPAALATAQHIKHGLQAAGFQIKTLPQMIS